MTAKFEGWHVGARVYLAYSHRWAGGCKWATVTKVGRKWVEYQLDGSGWRNPDDRFDAETMRMDGGHYASPGVVYLSEDDYKSATELSKAWLSFVWGLEKGRAPDGMTMEKLGQIKSILGMEQNGTGS